MEFRPGLGFWNFPSYLQWHPSFNRITTPYFFPKSWNKWEPHIQIYVYKIILIQTTSPNLFLIPSVIFSLVYIIRTPGNINHKKFIDCEDNAQFCEEATQNKEKEMFSM